MAVKHTAEVTISDLSDAYSVTLTNEAASFKATSDTRMGTAGTATTRPQAFMGADAVACAVTAADCVCSDPTNVSVSVNSSGDNATWPLLTITVGANATAGGTVTIPVVIGSGDSEVTIEKVFSYSIALKGSTGSAGKGISSTVTKYQVGTSATSEPTGTWQDSPQATSTGQYLWTRTVITYTDSTTSTSYSVAAHGATGSQGPQGDPGVSPTVTNSKTQYQKSTSGTAVPTGTWSDSALAPTTTEYVWTKTTVTYSNGNTAISYAVAGKVGAKGDPGDDPYTLSITSDNGTVLRNNAGQTTLTAHVFKAGAELSTMPSGHAVKWYVDGTLAETDSSLPATFTRTAAQVANKCVVCAKLEG